MSGGIRSLRSTAARLLWFLAESFFALGLWLLLGENGKGR